MRLPVRTIAALILTFPNVGGAQTIRGTVVDSVTNAVVRGARVTLSGTPHAATTNADGQFMFAAVAAGKYVAQVRTAPLDSLGIVSETAVAVAENTVEVRIRVPSSTQIVGSLCGTPRLGDGLAIVIGVVDILGDSLARGIRVVAEWQEIAVRQSGTRKRVETPTNWVEAQVDSLGTYRLCGVPVSTALLIRPEIDNRQSVNTASMDLSIPQGRLLAEADLTLDLTPVVPSDQLSLFTGTVFTDSTRQPLRGADVSFPDLGKRAVTDDSGAFRISGIIAGTHRLAVRQIGYGRLEGTVTFVAGATVDRKIYLSRVVMLDSMLIKSTAFDRARESFEENKKAGLGKFFTPEDMRKLENQTLGGALSTMQGTRVMSSARGSFLTSNRPRSLSQSGCLAHVYVDNMPMYVRPSDPPFDLRSISPDRIEAMEYYTGPAETPLKYSNLNSQCGVLVIWTRR